MPARFACTAPVTNWWIASSSPLVVATYAGSEASVRAMFVGQQETENHGARWLELARGVGLSASGVVPSVRCWSGLT